MEKIKIDLGFATLVAEKGTDKNYREIFIGLESKDGCLAPGFSNCWAEIPLCRRRRSCAR